MASRWPLLGQYIKDNIKELDVEELEENFIYEIDSVKDYQKLEKILSSQNNQLYELITLPIFTWLSCLDMHS